MTYGPGDRTAIAEYAVTLFASHDRDHTVWLPGPAQWVSAHKPLTAEAFLTAIATRVPISGYIGCDDNLTHVAALDFDTEDGWKQALELGKLYWEFGVPCAVEGSRRGAHMWFTGESRQPMRVWRKALKAGLQQSGLPKELWEGQPKIELRPGQDSLDPGMLGNALRMPTMPHPKTGRRYPLVDPRTEQPMGAGLGDMLLAVQPVTDTALLGLAGQYAYTVDTRHIPDRYRPPRAHGPDDELISEILQQIWGLVARPGKVVKCPVHDDRAPSLQILPDDKRAICHSTSCELNNDGRGVGTYQLRQIGFRTRSETRKEV